MARGILGGLFGGGDSSVMPGLLDAAGYMDPAEYDRRRQGDAMQGLWAGLLQGSGPSLEPRNFFSALGGGLAASQKSANEFDEAQLRRAQGVAAYQKSQLERDRLRLGYDVTQQYLRDQGAPTTPRPPGAPPATPDAGGGGGGNLSDPRGLTPYIRAEAARLNIDPDIAVRVAGSEGLGTFLGDGGKSGGAFQLYTGGGVGNLFQRDTGLDPLDPANEKATITYALQHAAKNGWGDWNGAKKLGITGYTGIGKPGESRASNVTDLSAVPDFTGAMMGQQGASYAPATPPPVPAAIAAGAPGPAPAPGATAAPSGTGTSGYLQPSGTAPGGTAAPAGTPAAARTGGYQFYGDSVAHGTRQAAGANGVTKVGWRPDQVLGSLTGANPQGDTVVISSGITNSTAADLPRDQWKRDIALVPQQIGAALKSGAGKVALYGVGDGVRDHDEINAALRQIATDSGAEFVPLIGTGAYTDRQGRAHAAGWHPSDYNAQNTYTRGQLGGEGAAPAPGATVGGRQPTAVPPVTSTPGGTNGIDLRRGAALEQILSGQQTAQAGPPLRQLAQFAGPGAAGPTVASAPLPPPLPAGATGEPAPGGNAPAPAAITYGSGVLGRLPPPPTTAAAAAAPADVAPAPGGTLPGAAAAPAPGSPNTMFGMPLPVLPAAPAPPQVPPIPGLLPPPTAPALTPLAPVGAAPPVQLPPEQAARTRRAQGLALGLDLMGVTVPKFIADEAGIEVAARSAAAQKQATQPFEVQMERLKADIAQKAREWDSMSKLQQDEYATKRGFAADQFKSALGQLDDVVKQYTAAGLAGPVARAQERAKLEEQQRLEPGIEQDKKIAQEAGVQFSVQGKAARAAAESLYGLDDARELLKGGIISGKGADLKLQILKAGSALGWSNERIANTEAYLATRAREVANTLSAGTFGAGSGISDNDRLYAAKMAAGDISLDNESIQRILDIQEKASYHLLNQYNQRARRVEARNPTLDLVVTPPVRRGGAATLQFNPQTGRLE